MKKTFRVMGNEWRVTGAENRASRHLLPVTSHPKSAFTLIEIMVVVAIMGIILATGIPSIYRLWKKEGLRKAVADVVEVCSNARARAIFSGSQVDVVFHPLEMRLEVGGRGGDSAPPAAEGEIARERPSPAPSSGTQAQLAEGVEIGALLVNGLNYRESEWTRVRFFPNGTSDEMRLVLASDKGEARGIELEVSTGLASVVADIQEINSWQIR